MKFLDVAKLILERYTPFKTHSSTGEIQSLWAVSGNPVWGKKIFKINFSNLYLPHIKAIVLAKPLFLIYSRNSPHFIHPEGTTPCTQKPATCPSPKSDESIWTLIYCRYKCTVGWASWPNFYFAKIINSKDNYGPLKTSLHLHNTASLNSFWYECPIYAQF